ncbi:hypothetical protein VTN00DRAFT_8148 [Thermoascus crustaceus]|uniref:uncharacterized protein n=1 Tax=Thermoascus crustaceus TaxID=5088 RepID=UPI0037432E41
MTRKAVSPSYSSFSSSSVYPSSLSSVSAPPLPNLASPPRRQAHLHFDLQVRARDHLEGLIKKHGRPTVVYSTSSLRSLTSTSPSISPPSLTPPPSPPASAVADALETLSITPTGTRPIPIPRPPSTRSFDDLPITPLTGRFDKGHFFPHAEHHPVSSRNTSPVEKKRSRGSRTSSRPKSEIRMHSDGSTQVYSLPSTMPQPGRPASPHSSRSRPQNSPKSAPTINLGNLPKFHPAVYQSSNVSHHSTSQPPSPVQQRPQTYRMSSASRDALRQYREFVTSTAFPRNGSISSTRPSAPRLDPLGSPGPVTPLALEEEGGYLVAGAVNSSEVASGDNRTSGPSPELIEKLIQRENERILSQKSRRDSKGR